MAPAVSRRIRLTDGERRFVLDDVGWQGYETLLNLVGNRPIRLTYDRGNVELLSPLLVHERYRSLLARVVEVVTKELNIRMVAAGSTTLRAELLDRGLEPDACFYIASADRLRGTDRIDLSVVPPPDLVIEIEIARSVLQRLGIYAALGVPEIWRFDGERLCVLVLQADGLYAESDRSASFPFLPLGEVTRLALEGDLLDDTAWSRSFRAWVRHEILPRLEDDRAQS
jgi:Uma2 family endonuclease